MSFALSVPFALSKEFSCARLQCESLRDQRSSLASWLDGQVGDALRHGRSALDRHHTDCRPAHSASWLVMMLTLVREYDQAFATLDHSMPQHAQMGSASIDLPRHIVRARAELDRDGPGEELDHLRRALRGREDELPECWRLYMHMLLADAALRHSDVAAADHHTRLMAEGSLLATINIIPIGRVSWAVIRRKDAEHGREVVLPLVHRLVHAEVACRNLLMTEPTAGAWLVRALMEAGDHESAQAVVSASRQVASGAPKILALRAGALHTQGVFLGDEDALRFAASLHYGRWATAAATEDLAALVSLREPSSDETSALLKAALAGYEAAKSPRDVARVKQELRKLGHRLYHPPAGDTNRGQGPLSPAERSVADLVAQGLTNAQVAERLFLSQHTVASHLRTIFRKLGLKSRVELARTWGAHRPIP